MKPSIGRTVIVKGIQSNGTDEHPAIINRVWSEKCVNLTAFPDCGLTVFRSSVAFYPDRAAAEIDLKAMADEEFPRAPLVAFPPDRV